MAIQETELAITVERAWHGPFERFTLSAVPAGGSRADLSPFYDPGAAPTVSVYRVGDVLIGASAARLALGLVAGLHNNPPSRVLLTHSHEDHAGGLTALRQAFGGIAIYAPRALSGSVRNPGAALPYRDVCWGAMEPIKNVQDIDEGDLFSTSLLTLRAVSTPGHCPGHLSFVAHAGDELYVLSGDLFLPGSPIDAWYESSAPDTISSLRRLAGQGSEVILLPSRGRVRTKGSDALRKAADRLEQEADTLRVLSERTGLTNYWQLAQQAYGDDPLIDITGGEFGRACFVRSVLDPIILLPAGPLPRPAQLSLM